MDKWTIIFAIGFSFTLAEGTFAIDSSCMKLFAKAKIKPGPECLPSCATITSNAPAFSPESVECADECLDFCQSNVAEKFIFQLSDLYPRLNVSERALAATHPMDTLKAYKLSWKAEGDCLTIYRRSLTNDESDACRHFVWAALLKNEFGGDFASKLLNAHEGEPDQPTRERDMDLANNKRGQIAADALKKGKNFSDENILKAFKEDLSKGRLIIIKPGARKR